MCCVLVVLAFPAQVLAWGGGTHLALGLEVLSRSAELPPALVMLLMRHPNDFLYGCLAADITVGKKFTHYLLNCHRWGVGERVLQVAETDQQRACAYGYLCHLAADVVAHNYYVPFKTVQSFASVALRHTYWELRFEALVDPAVWKRARGICKNGRTLDDELLRRVVTPTIFSFGTSRRIFNSLLLLSRLKRWQKLIRGLSGRSRHRLVTSERNEYFEVTMGAVMDLLTHGPDAACRLLDPTGEDALSISQDIRRTLRARYHMGMMSREEGVERVESLRPLFRQALHQPELLRELQHRCNS
ncbi:Zn_dep_PLPC domain-containing protein [Trichlorobacter ammonificans]|uniref:Zn_dep_PLPC domain-containing protein n=2 Tax=Trichlorobacter ammonificans TaxID=2916410 RepID=A0ABN8HRJ0_9BACT|nr:Zn_dep_PLPC domain-containing protein [Trichlorobacter ammonificans]